MTTLIDKALIKSLGALASDGIVFPATPVTSADVNTLDHYEEGVFTPIISYDGVTTGINHRANLVAGSYTKIGNIVSFKLVWSFGGTAGDEGSGTGNLRIAGMPFVFENAGLEQPVFPVYVQDFSGLNGSLVSFGNGGQSYMELIYLNAGINSPVTHLNTAHFSGQKISGTYEIA